MSSFLNKHNKTSGIALLIDACFIILRRKLKKLLVFEVVYIIFEHPVVVTKILAAQWIFVEIQGVQKNVAYFKC